MVESLRNVSQILSQPLWAWWYAQCLQAARSRRFFLGLTLTAILQLLSGQLGAALRRNAGRGGGDGIIIKGSRKEE